MINLHQILADTRKSYDLAAGKYFELFGDEMKEKPFDRNLLDAFAAGFNHEAVLCDMGCGPGTITRYLFDKGLNIRGIDISETCIQIARAQNPQMTFQVMDQGNTSFEDESFDGIISFYSIIHTPKAFLPATFQEFNRILKPDGKLLVVVKEGREEGYQQELLGYETPIYYSFFSDGEMKRLFEENGFRITCVEIRKPYYFEIQVSRIYMMGEKIL